MTTVSELTRDVLGSAATDVGGPAVAKWIDNRYKEMVAKVKFRSLRQVGELYLPAVVTEGTVTATRGDTAVAGTSTTWATSPTVASHDDWFFRPASAWYRIASVASNTALTLDTNFAEDTISTAVSYNIAKRYHTLASDARRLGTFVHSRLRRDLEAVSLTELDIIAPGRILVSSLPNYVSETGIDSSGYKQVEIYPAPATTEIIHYVYWKIPDTLSIGTTIPQAVDTYILKEGALVDLYRYNKSKALTAGNIEIAATWANEEHKQRTRWERYLTQAQRQDRGVDDITFVLNMISDVNRSRYADIATARDHVLANWNYPG